MNLEEATQKIEDEERKIEDEERKMADEKEVTTEFDVDLIHHHNEGKTLKEPKKEEKWGAKERVARPPEFTVEVKLTRNENCSFLQIEKKLDRADRLLHFAGIVIIVNDFSNPEMSDIRKTQLRDSLSEACAALSDAVDLYERLVRVRGGGLMNEPTEYFCRACVDCPEDGGLVYAGRSDRKPCPLRAEEPHTEIRKLIERNIKGLVNLFVTAADKKHGCGEFPYEPELGVYGPTVREVICKWIKRGYYRDVWQWFPETDDENNR